MITRSKSNKTESKERQFNIREWRGSVHQWRFPTGFPRRSIRNSTIFNRARINTNSMNAAVVINNSNINANNNVNNNINNMNTTINNSNINTNDIITVNENYNVNNIISRKLTYLEVGDSWRKAGPNEIPWIRNGCKQTYRRVVHR